MKNEQITMPVWANHLSEFMSELPVGIFNKKITATGATTLVMENPQSIILLCPDNGLIDNKLKQYRDGSITRCNYQFLKINCKVANKEIIQYIEDCKDKQPVKLLCTYDSLHKLLAIPNVYDDYHLVVDEFQELLKLGKERERKGIIILDEFSKFKKYTFLSATPLKQRVLPDSLKDVDYTELKITNSEKIKVIGQQTDKPFSLLVDLIKNFKIEGEFKLLNKSCKHLYIYLNSVTSIANIIQNAGLTQKDVNIFCGDYTYNGSTLDKVGCEIGDLFTKKQLEEHPEYEPSIHFITSKGFKGCDIYSNDGLAIFVVNTHIKSTVSGMSTLQQISGRIRTKSNPFKNIIYHIYNVNRAALTYEEYLKEQQEQIDASQDIINDWKSLLKGSRESIIRDLNNAEWNENVCYHFLDGDTMRLNDLNINSDRENHIAENLIYTQGIEVRKAYTDEGYEDYSAEYLSAESTFKNFVKHMSFKEYCNAYNDSLKSKFYIGEPLFGCSVKSQKLIRFAFEKLGYAKIKELKFHQSRIKDHLQATISYNTYGIITSINKAFKIGKQYGKTEIKEIIQSVYKRNGFKRKATATLINDYFETRGCKLENGNKGIILVKPRNSFVHNLKGNTQGRVISTQVA